MYFSFARKLFAIFAVLALGTALQAQQTTGQIVGAIADESGAVIPNAQITVSNLDTGQTFNGRSNSSGNFSIAALPPAQYEVKVEAQGFGTAVRKNVRVEVGKVLTLNTALKAGTTTQVIEVTGEAPLIETTRSDLGGSVSTQEVKELPLQTRNFANLSVVVPGVRPAQNFDPTKTKVGNVSLNGGDGRQFDVNVDGGDNKDNVVGGLVQNYTVEGIQEFNVVTNRYTAESGRTLGGVVNVVTKSGTNAIHGSLLGLFQVSTFNQNDKLNEDAGQDKPVYHRYHFGGSVGGPIIKDKLFYFGAYEQKREPGSLTALPDAFNELSLFTPANGGFATPVRLAENTYIDHLGTAKVDWRLSDRQNMSFRYARQKWTQPNDQLGNPFVSDLSQGTSNTNQFHDFTAQHNFLISPTKTNQLTLHYGYFFNGILPDPGVSFSMPIAGGGTAENPNILFPSGFTIGQNVNVPQSTFITKYQFRDDFSWLVNKHAMKFGVNYIYEPKLGGTFFFGANGYQINFWDDPSSILNNPGQYPQGFATPGAVQELLFSGGNGSFNQKPHQLAFYFQDDYKITNRLTLNLGLRWDANIDYLPEQLGSGLSDTNRTVGLLRRLLAVNPSGPGTAEAMAQAQLLAGDTDRLRRTTTNWKEFQPRLGFAWDIAGNGKYVLRGGYGIAFDQVFQNLTVFSIQQAHPNIYQTAIDIVNNGRPGACTTASPMCSFRFGVDPLPAPVPPPGGDDLAVGGLGFMIDPRMTDPYAQQTSIGFAWQFANDFAVSIDYYHVLGVDEPRVLLDNPLIGEVCDPSFPTANPADPRCVAGANTRLLDPAFAAAALVDPSLVGAGRIAEIRNLGTNNRSNYNTLNLQLKKRFSKNFTFQTSYVNSYSNSWGGRPTSSYSGTALAVTRTQQFQPTEYGHTGFDERHRFVFSGVFELPAGFEVSPIFQTSSARPYNFRADADIDGDGRRNLDRVCVGSTLASPIIAPGCTQFEINPLRGDPFVQMDLRLGKNFRFGERMGLRLYWEFFNLFDRANFGNNFGERVGTSTFDQPVGYFGIGSPDPSSMARGFSGDAPIALRSQFGFRFEF